MTTVPAILDSLSGVRRIGRQWLARCPAHDDRQPSLAIAQGSDGRVLVWCFAGCSAEQVVEAMGLRLADLMPESGSYTNTMPVLRPPAAFSLVSERPRPARTFPSAKDAVAELERTRGRRAAHWVYRDADGVAVGVVVRWNLPGGRKTIIPVSRRPDGWVIGGMPVPRPLYRLPEVIAAARVFVCEGEKACEAGRSLGLTCTSSAHGSQSAGKSDWTPLAGKEVVILPDNDAAGEAYAEDVISILSNLRPTPTIKVVRLPGLPLGGDLADFVALQGKEASCSAT